MAYRHAGMGAAPVDVDPLYKPSQFTGSELNIRAKMLANDNGYIPPTGIEENLGDPYSADSGYRNEDARNALTQALDAGVDSYSFVNPYRTVMYSITGLSTTIPIRVLPGNFKRSYLLIQNLGPGNMFVGIGTDPANATGNTNVLQLVSTQIYEQVGGGSYIPPNPWYPNGFTLMSSFVSPEYISLLIDTASTNAMILEGTFSPPRQGAVSL